jgi:arsenate reductase
MQKVYRTLFLCPGNSARSIMAECILDRLGQGWFQAYSAGSHPKGRVHPFAIELLRDLGYKTEGLRSKSWDEFARPDAPRMDFVFTVCDSAAGEVCPVWPGCPVTAHWSFPDPAAFKGSDPEKRALFADVYDQIFNRISGFVGLRIGSLDGPALNRCLDEIGRKQLKSA